MSKVTLGSLAQGNLEAIKKATRRLNVHEASCPTCSYLLEGGIRVLGRFRLCEEGLEMYEEAKAIVDSTDKELHELVDWIDQIPDAIEDLHWAMGVRNG